MAMDDQFVLNHLPTKPGEVVKRLVREYRQDLGGEYTVARRVSRELPPDMNELRCGITRKRKTGWMAECTCTACHDTWYTHWNCSGSISVYEGPDAQIYEWAGEDIDYTEGQVVVCASPDTIICPNCGEHTTLVFSSALRTPRRRTRAFQTVEVIGKYGAVVTWLGTRRVDRDAFVDELIVPWKASVVDECRKLHSFSWQDRRWKRVNSLVRAELTIYNTPDGSFYGAMIGAYQSLEIPPLIGTTLEKSGLREYLKSGGEYPTEYLRFWRAATNIENLMKSPFRTAVQSLLDQSLDLNGTNDSRRKAHFELPINLDLAKPYLMLGMDKRSFRHFCREDAPIWSDVALTQWLLYHGQGGRLDAVGFYQFWLKYKSDGMDTMLDMMAFEPGIDIDRIDWYLIGKQGLEPHDLHLVPDMWKMARTVYLRPELTREELWPRNLVAAHDRLAAMIKVNDDDRMQAQFDRIRAALAPVAFSDGELCVVIPAANSELVREGEILRHCVGSYGDTHCNGKPVFFIRHARRPERPYYTLNMDLTGKTPKRLQLHGYGNERYGESKQYTHKIPKKVLDFCAHWEAQVLRPFWVERQKQQEVSA